MQDLSVLTPPLLMCTVVVIAIVAFLRHEMNRSRTDSSTPGENSVDPPQTGDDLPSRLQGESDASRTTSTDG
jgi:hypothetical protein